MAYPGRPVEQKITSRRVIANMKDEFRALIDGFSLEEQPDGTILVHGKKSYPHPDDGLGAIWRDVWINLTGEIVRKGEIAERGSDH